MEEGGLPYENNLLEIAAYYAIDWLAVLGVLGLLGIVGTQQTRERFYLVHDPAFSYPEKEDTITKAEMYMFGLLLPLSVCILLQLVCRKRWNWALDLHHFGLGLAEAAAVSELCTVSLKRFCGRLRPSAFARMQNGDPSFDMSFPSGHTSFSFTGMTFLALYLCGKTGVFSKTGLVWRKRTSADPFRGSFASAALSLLVPVGLAAFVGATRLTDYAHDFSDVNAGVLIGVAAGSLGYFLNFPFLSSPLSHVCRPLALQAPPNRLTEPLSQM